MMVQIFGWFQEKSIRKDPVGLFVIFLIISSFFAYTVKLRSPFFGVLAYDHSWLSGSTIVFATNWLREGIFNLRFLMLEDPASIEFSDLLSRSPYVSYPCGAPLQLYVLSLIIGKEPTPFILMGLNLCHHLAISLILSSIAWVTLNRQYLVLRTAYSVLAGVSYLILPKPMLCHQNIFFADQAVIIYFVLTVLLEIIHDSPHRSRRFMSIAQSVIIFLGCLTDWLMVFVAGTVFLKRVLFLFMKNELTFLKAKKEATPILTPIILSISLFLWQIFSADQFNALYSRFMLRSGISPEGAGDYKNFNHDFWMNILGPKFTKLFFVSIGVPVLYFFYVGLKKNVLKPSRFSFSEDVFSIHASSLMLTLPCLLQVYMFRNHSVVHDFSALKFFVPIALVPYIFIPTLIKLLLDRQENPQKLYMKYLKPFGVFVQLTFLVWGGIFLKNNKQTTIWVGTSLNDQTVAAVIRKTTDYNSLVFSSFMEIPRLPPQLLALSMKRVYKIEKLADVRTFLEEKLKNKHPDIYVVIKDHGEEKIQHEFDSLIIEEKVYKEGFKLLKINDPRMRIPFVQSNSSKISKQISE